MQAALQAGVSAAEIAKFDALASRWWDPAGPMRELHRMNALRIGWMQRHIHTRFGPASLKVLDVGCGGGIASEALAVLGHDVLGLDAAAEAVTAARAHATASGVKLAYRVGTTDELAAEGARFQAIAALEVIEHVPDPAAFVASLARLLEPGGLLFVSTLNRTARSYALAIVGAEMVARLVPRGTHEWRRFVTPPELARHFRAAGLRLADVAGMVPDLPARSWRQSRDTAVNYIAMGEASGTALG